MPEWLAQVSAELGLPDEVAAGVTRPLLDLVREVAHGVNRPSGPLTAYLVGVAAGLAAAGEGTADEVGPGAGPLVEATTEAAARVQGLVDAHVAATADVPAEG